MHETDLIELVAVGLGLAFVFGAVANRLRLSPLVGYLVAGILVGPFTPGFVADQELALQLSELGVMLLMFGVGLHFSLDDLIEVRGIAIPGAVGQMVVATLLGSAMAFGLGWSWAEGLVFGLALSVASTVVLLRALDERRLLETSRGRIAVGWLIVEDLVTVLALVLLPALAGAAGGTGSVLGAVGRTVLSLTGFVAVMLLVGRRVVPWTLERVAATGSRELFTLAVLAIALGVAFASALLFNVSFALGAFFAGMLLNGSELSAKAAADSLPLRDAFAVLFFVSVGMLFDPDILVDHPWQVLATVSIVIVGKSAAAYGIVRLFRHRADTAMTVSVSLAQIGEFSFVLAALAVSLDLIPDEGRDLVVAGALISILVNPFLFAALDRRLARTGHRVGPEDEAPPGPALAAGDHAIVIGYGRVGSVVADDLGRFGIPVIVVDEHEELVDSAHRAGIPGIRGNAASDAVLAATHPETARIAVVAIPQPLEAGEVLVKLRGMNPSLVLLARAHSDGEVAHLLEHGADDAVMAERELAHSLAERVVSAFPDPAGDGEVSTAPLAGGAQGRG